MTILITNDGPVRVITFNHESKANPFSHEMQISLTKAAKEAGDDDSVGAVVFTGGQGRYFSAGGDFNEVQLLRGGDDVDRWIDTFMDMYLALLNIPKPTFGAIDGYAIGIGFQVALMLDWRIMSSTSTLSMPELRHGIGATVGGAILSTLYGTDTARETMLGALDFTAAQSLERRFVQEVTPPETLMQQTLMRAHERAEFPNSAYRSSKSVICGSLDRALRETMEVSKKIHRAAFEKRTMAGHFETILNRSSIETNDTAPASAVG